MVGVEGDNVCGNFFAISVISGDDMLDFFLLLVDVVVPFNVVQSITRALSCLCYLFIIWLDSELLIVELKHFVCSVFVGAKANTLNCA